MVNLTFRNALLPAVAAMLALHRPSQAQTQHWVGTWAASQQIPEPANSLPPADLTDATLRQIVHLSLGGTTLRIHLSNAFGTSALHLTSVHIARPVSPAAAAIDPATDCALTFAGQPDVTIPPGAQYLSDPIVFPSAALSDLAVSIHFDAAPSQETGHPGSRSTSYYVHGDAVSQPDLPNAKKVEHWYNLAGVDVPAPQQAFSVVTLGDSITDGHAATTNGNTRWPDVLAQRLQADPHTRTVGVLNQGIGGNHLLTDGLGPNVLARLDRDVLAQPGVRTVIVLEGINDLGALARTPNASEAQHDALVHNLIAAYQQILDRCHAQGLRVLGATITPDTGSDYYHPSAADEAARQQINQWIRTAGHFDDVIDFDKAVSDPADPTRLRTTFDCGDHLHPNPTGYKAMGEAIPLKLLMP